MLRRHCFAAHYDAAIAAAISRRLPLFTTAYMLMLLA